jgi:hypothetical protein
MCFPARAGEIDRIELTRNLLLIVLAAQQKRGIPDSGWLRFIPGWARFFFDAAVFRDRMIRRRTPSNRASGR